MYMEVEFPRNNEKGEQSSVEYVSDASDNEINPGKGSQTPLRPLSKRKDRDAECKIKKVRFAYGFAAQQGIRPTMEDAHFTGKEEVLFLVGICDGHNGSQASSFVARHFYGEFKQRLISLANRQNISFPTLNNLEAELKVQNEIADHNDKVPKKSPRQLLQNVEANIDQGLLYRGSFNDEDVKQAILGACEAVENRFMQFASQFDLDDGTTFCTILLMNECLYCANIGDSRALCGGWRGMTQLSNDHKADYEEPYVRAVGGFVHPLITKTPSSLVMCGPQRIFPGGLAVSRSIGDRQFKDEQHLKTMGVIKQLVRSDVDVWKVSAWGQTYAFVGCDGVFDVMSSLDVHKVLMVLAAVQNAGGTLRRAFLAKAGVGHDLRIAGPGAIAADVVTRLALAGGSTDNVSCCALLFQHAPWPVRKDVAVKLELKGNVWSFSDNYNRKIQVSNTKGNQSTTSITPTCKSGAEAQSQEEDEGIKKSGKDSSIDSNVNLCMRDYGNMAFGELCGMAIKSGTWSSVKGVLELHDYIALYDILDRFFCFPEHSLEIEVLHDPKLSDSQLQSLDLKRRELWTELQNKGQTLSALRVGQASTGIETANEGRFQALQGQEYKF